MRNKENELFNKILKGSKYRDGVVNPKRWEQASPKVMFVLKETNELDGDLRDFLNAGGKGTTWNNIARWSALFENINDDISYKEIDNSIKENRKKYLSKICAVNLKKSAGGASTNDKIFKEQITDADIELLREQIKLYKPNYIICCGKIISKFLVNTDNIAKRVIENRKWISHFKIKNKIYSVWRDKNNNAFIIEFRHPNNRSNLYSNEALFKSLLSAIKECEIKQ